MSTANYIEILKLYVIPSGLGIILVWIYFVDGWKTPKDATVLEKTPRIVGLLFVLSGGVLSATQISSSDPRSTIVYLASVVVAFFITVTALLIIGVIYSTHKLRMTHPASSKGTILVQSIHHVIRLFTHGWEEFHAELNRFERDSAIKHCRNIISFSKAYYNGVIEISEKNKESAKNFSRFLSIYMQLFSTIFFGDSNQRNFYRLCVLWFDEGKNELRIIACQDNGNTGYGIKPLPFESLAGDATQKPNVTLCYPFKDGTKHNFCQRENMPFKSLYVRAIAPVDAKNSHTLVLAIDNSSDNPDKLYQYLDEAIGVFAVGLAHARSLFKISDKHIQDWIKIQDSQQAGGKVKIIHVNDPDPKSIEPQHTKPNEPLEMSVKTRIDKIKAYFRPPSNNQE